MARQGFIDDSGWTEVIHIYKFYAMNMAYLTMGVRGLSFLVLTWTTVVLLGGFVSDLSKKDFWALTLITLVQPAGIFDFLLKESINDVVSSLFSSLVGLFTAPKTGKGLKEWIFLCVHGRRRPTSFLSIFKVVRAISTYPLAVLYVLGVFISTAVSLWRLVQHDYGDANGGENLKPALRILYSLAVAQGVVFGYRAMFEWGRTSVAAGVADSYSLDSELVSGYLEETLTGCMKDPSFPGGRNLITYAVNLMESKLRQDHLSGVRILGTMLHGNNFSRSGQAVLMKQLLTGSVYFSHIVQRLVETFGCRSPYSTEIREHAARIVANVAGTIHLEQFPAGMILVEYISFLLKPYAQKEYSWRAMGYEQDRHCLPKEYEQGWLLEGEELIDLYWREKTPIQRVASAESGKGLMVQGLRILQKLIMHEDNCRVIINTECLLSRAMEPLILDQLHRDHDDEWSSVAEESLELTSRLLAYPEEVVGADMGSKISANKEIIISTLKRILECPKCEVLLKRQAVEMLLYLQSSEKTSSIVTTGSGSSRIFKWLLLHIFTMEDKCFGKMCGSIHWAMKSTEIRKLAGEKLQEDTLYPQAEGSTISMVLQSVSGVIMGDLARAVIVDDVDKTYRLHAVQILKHLCILYTKDEDFVEELKKTILKVMRKVLKEILGWGLSAPPGHDIEAGGPSPGHVQLNTSCHEPHDGRKLREALLSLCQAVDRRWIYEDGDFTRQLDDIAAEICSEQGHLMVRLFRGLVWYAERLLEKEKKSKKEKGKKAQRSANVSATSSRDT